MKKTEQPKNVDAQFLKVILGMLFLIMTVPFISIGAFTVFYLSMPESGFFYWGIVASLLASAQTILITALFFVKQQL